MYDHCAYTLIIIKKIYFFSLLYIRNQRKEHTFWRQKKNKESEFFKNKKAFQIEDADVNKILVSKKEPYSSNNALKYFIGYNDNHVLRPFCLRLPQVTGYTKKTNENATMSSTAKNKHLLKYYSKIWEKLKSWWW